MGHPCQALEENLQLSTHPTPTQSYKRLDQEINLARRNLSLRNQRKSDFTFKGSKDLGGNGGRGLLPERRGLKKSLRTWRSFDYTYLRLQTVLMRIYYMGL